MMQQMASEVDNTVTNKPGVIWIGTERIEYSKVSGNVLSDIVRGTHGTTIQKMQMQLMYIVEIKLYPMVIIKVFGMQLVGVYTHRRII